MSVGCESDDLPTTLCASRSTSAEAVRIHCSFVARVLQGKGKGGKGKGGKRENKEGGDEPPKKRTRSESANKDEA
jgi:hypothetical protein